MIAAALSACETSSCRVANDRFGSVPLCRARTNASGNPSCTAATSWLTDGHLDAPTCCGRIGLHCPASRSLRQIFRATANGISGPWRPLARPDSLQRPLGPRPDVRRHRANDRVVDEAVGLGHRSNVLPGHRKFASGRHGRSRASWRSAEGPLRLLDATGSAAPSGACGLSTCS
jgi:hypothetical protein